MLLSPAGKLLQKVNTTEKYGFADCVQISYRQRQDMKQLSAVMLSRIKISKLKTKP